MGRKIIARGAVVAARVLGSVCVGAGVLGAINLLLRFFV